MEKASIEDDASSLMLARLDSETWERAVSKSPSRPACQKASVTASGPSDPHADTSAAEAQRASRFIVVVIGGLLEAVAGEE